jgi:hypothetical protein
MKRSVMLFAIILLFPLLSAVQIDLSEEAGNFSQGETLTARISGYFLTPITQSNILFYRESVRVPMNFELSKIQSDYYLSAQLEGKTPGNYSFVIEGVRYVNLTKETEEPITKSFTITEEIADFSISPSFVETTQDFQVELKNLRDIDINIQFPKGNVTLNPGQLKKVDFSLNDLKGLTMNYLLFTSKNTKYYLLVYVPIEITQTKEKSLSIIPSELNAEVSTNSAQEMKIYIRNTGELEIKDITLNLSDSLTDFVKLSRQTISELGINQQAELTLTLLSKQELNVEGTLKAMQDDTLLAFSEIALSFIPNYNSSKGDKITYETGESCQQMNGNFCSPEKPCITNQIEAKDGMCCLGPCQAPTPALGKILGWGLLAAAVLFVIWFFLRKYKGTKNPVDLLKVAKGKPKE